VIQKQKENRMKGETSKTEGESDQMGRYMEEEGDQMRNSKNKEGEK
jgi:hypothetical protein